MLLWMCACSVAALSNEAEVFLRKALQLYTQVLKLHLHFKSFIRSGNTDKLWFSQMHAIFFMHTVLLLFSDCIFINENVPHAIQWMHIWLFGYCHVAKLQLTLAYPIAIFTRFVHLNCSKNSPSKCSSAAVGPPKISCMVTIRNIFPFNTRLSNLSLNKIESWDQNAYIKDYIELQHSVEIGVLWYSDLPG